MRRLFVAGLWLAEPTIKERAAACLATLFSPWTGKVVNDAVPSEDSGGPFVADRHGNEHSTAWEVE